MSNDTTMEVSKAAMSEIRHTVINIRAQKSVNHSFINEAQKRLQHDHGISFSESAKLILDELNRSIAADQQLAADFKKQYSVE